MRADNTNEDAEQHSENKWYNHKPTKSTIALAGLVIYGFFVLVDAHDIWPWSPLAAVGIGVPITIAVLYFEVFVTEAIGFRSFLISSVVIIVGGAIIYFIAPRAKVEEKTVTGSLLPANEPTPPNYCETPTGRPFIGLEMGGADIGIAGTPSQLVGNLPKDATLVLLGRNVRVITENDKAVILKLGTCPLISVRKSGDSLFIDAEIFDEAGALIGKIKDNAFEAIEGERSHVERQGDLSTLIIKDVKGTELLWVRFLNPKAVQIRGIFRCSQSSTKTVAVTNNDVKGIFPSMPVVARNLCTPTGFIGFP
jgi:hypothetical protein